MKKHVKIYLKTFGFWAERFEDLYIPCEWRGEGCENRAVDINHIEPRGRGGDPTGAKDTPQNLCALCRVCHNKFELKQISKQEMIEKHLILCRAKGIM